MRNNTLDAEPEPNPIFRSADGLVEVIMAADCYELRIVGQVIATFPEFRQAHEAAVAASPINDYRTLVRSCDPRWFRFEDECKARGIQPGAYTSYKAGFMAGVLTSLIDLEAVNDLAEWIHSAQAAGAVQARGET